MGINIKQDYGEIEKSLLGGLKESLIKKGREEIEAAFDEMLKKPITINGKKMKIKVSDLSESVYDQIIQAFMGGKSFSPKVRGFDLNKIIGLDNKTLEKKLAELSKFIKEAPIDVNEKELSTKTKHFVSSYLVSKNRGMDTSAYDKFYNDLMAESEVQEQAIKQITEQIVAYNISTSESLKELSSTIADKLGQKKKREIEILGKVFDADTQIDEISKEMDKLITEMKNIVFHAGNLDKKTINSKGYRPSDNLKSVIEDDFLDTHGSGTFFSSNFVDVLDWFEGLKQTKEQISLYVDDLSKYSGNMLKLSSYEMSEDYGKFLERLSLFVLSVETSSEEYKKRLKDEGITSIDDLYRAGEDYFSNFRITIDQLSEWIESEVKYIKSIEKTDKFEKSHNISTRFQQHFLKTNGVDASKTIGADDVGRGSIVFEIDKKNPYVINFGDNTDIAKMFYDKVMERIISDKAKYALSEDDIIEIVDAYIPDGLKGSIVSEQLKKKLITQYKASKSHYKDDFEGLNGFVDSDSGLLDSKSVEQILDANDALDKNLQKQKEIVSEKEKEVEVQEELNDSIQKQSESIADTEVPIEKMEQYQMAVEEVVDSLSNVDKAEEKIVSKPETPIVSEKTVDQVEEAEEVIDEFERKIQGIKEFSQNYDLFDFKDFDEETLDKLQSTLFALNDEDLKKLGFENTDEILEDLASINERLSEVRWQFENNDFTDEGWVASDELDDYFDSSTKLSTGYEHVREVADSARMSIQNLINIISGYNEGQAQDIIDAKPNELKILEQEVKQEKELTSVKEDQLQTTREAEQVNDEVRSSFIDEIRKAIDATKEETSTIKQLDETSKDTSETQISNYKRIKQAIIDTRAEIEKLNSLDLQNIKIPDYVEKTYQAKTAKYKGLSDDEFNDKIIEKSQEGLSATTHDFRVQMVSILAMIDEAKRRGKELKFEDLISGSPEELNKAQEYFQKIITYISSLNDQSFIDTVPEKLREATIRLRDLEEELEKVAKSSSKLDSLDYEINTKISNLLGKRKGINSDEADSLLRTLNDIYKETGKDAFIEDYTDNEKIIAGVNKRLAQLKSLEEQAAKHAQEAAEAEKQQAAANEQVSETIKEQTNAIIQNTNAQETNTAIKSGGTIPMPNSIKGGFKDESNVVSGVVGAEITSLEELKNKIFEVRDAIENKTMAFNDELSTVERVVGDERASLNLLRDKLAEIKGFVIELYNQIGNLDKVDFNTKIEVKGLSTLLSSLKDDKLDSKLTAIYSYLDDFAKAVNQIDFKNNLTQELNTILSKGEELKNLANILKKVNKTSIKDVKNNIDSKNTEALNKYNTAYKVLIDSEEKFQALSNKKETSLLSEKEAVELSKITSRRKEAKEIIEETTKILIANGNKINELSDAQDRYTSKVEETTEAFKAGAEARAKMEETNNRSSLESGLQKEIEAMEKMASMSHKYTGDFRNYLADEIKSASMAFKGTDEEIEQMILHLKEVRENVPTGAFENTFLTLDKYGLRIQNFLAKNTAMSEEFKIKLQEIYNTIQKYKDVGGDIDLKSILSDIVKIEDKVTGLGQTGKSAADKLKQQLQHIWRQDFARYFGLYDIIRYIRQIATEVIKVDTALTELRKVSDATNERLQQSFQKSSDTAKELGATISDVINVTADWARLKY